VEDLFWTLERLRKREEVVVKDEDKDPKKEETDPDVQDKVPEK
jgi:hypothetical protein